ncbi:MAG: hypothetical protein Q4G67_01610, partial [Actinomycetia bacterium]|nr:hypothetical protein [Actinomycetes bacterium]
MTDTGDLSPASADLTAFLASFRTLSDAAHQAVHLGDGTRFSDALSEFLGRPAREVPVVTEVV